MLASVRSKSVACPYSGEANLYADRFSDRVGIATIVVR